MAPSYRRMHVPGSDQYEALPPAKRFEACLEALNDEAQSSAPRPHVVAFFKQKLETARMAASAEDFYWALTNNLSIMTLAGKQTIFKPSGSQERVARHVLDRLETTKAVRLIYLAARRTWKSAICANIIYEFTKRTPGCTSAVLAHRDDTLQEIFGKYEYAYAYDKLQPSTRKANTYELVFDKLRSQIKAFNANSTRAGVLHGFNPRGVHASEASHFESSHELFAGLLIAVPSPPVPSIVILECRGGFPDGYVYEKVRQEIQEPGSSGFDLLFDGWPQRQDAVRQFASDDEAKRFRDKLTDEERAVMKALDLSLEQVHWWRETYRSVYFHGDHAEALREWNKDNPLTPMDAFQGVDEKVFDSVKVDEAIKVSQPPEWVGTMTAPSPMILAGRLQVWATPAPILSENKLGGHLSVWEWPTKDCEYVIGADIARGSAGATGGDYNVAVGLCRHHRRQAFRIRTRMSWVEFIDLLRLASKHWRDAVMNIEANYRPEIIDEMTRTDRVNCLYIRRDAKRTDIGGELGQRYGWEMTAGTKRMLIHKVQEKLHYEPGLFNDAVLLREMQVFRSVQSSPDRDPTYRGAMGKGQHDDVVIAFGLALWCDYDTPNLPKIEPAPAPDQIPETIHGQWLAQVEHMRRDNDGEAWDAVYDDAV